MASRRAAGVVVRSVRALLWWQYRHQATLIGSNRAWSALEPQEIAAGAACKSAVHACAFAINYPCSFNAQLESVAFPRQRLASQLTRSFASGDLPSHQEIGMPSLSPTMTQGNIAKWRKKEGEKVVAGDVLCEIETDKATLEMESMEEGYLAKIIVGDGAKDIKVGQPICIVVEDESEISKFSTYEAADAPGDNKGNQSPLVEQQSRSPSTSASPSVMSESSRLSSSPQGDRIFASPAAKKLADVKSISLSGVQGTGPEGRILRADVEDLLASAPSPSYRTQPQDEVPSITGDPDFTDIPITQIRRVIAQRLLISKQTIPHYYLSIEMHLDNLNATRNQLNASLDALKGKKLSINDFVIKAAALALRNVPQCNSSWTDEFIRQYRNVNIGVAVQTDFGLMVPVINDADRKGLLSISEDVKALADKARKNGLKPTDYQGGTFTVSNLGGPFGIKQFCAIINPPQSGILAVGSGTVSSPFPAIIVTDALEVLGAPFMCGKSCSREAGHSWKRSRRVCGSHLHDCHSQL
eukprot:TRINITY_DN447_c0_g1_i4.p1 TRINITY_DN447_c0_g1~~TRINITY_DN447_c0_g1_i4.p1  ORF type:complete len:536 (-),score=79.51 TRINITY_DN447_c0_g1_i4:454-2031(-)